VPAKPLIVHVIDSLTRGGAETLLVNLLPALAERYDIVLVTLRPDSDFEHDQLAVKALYCLGYTGSRSLPACAWKLRRIIRRHRPALVRAQLFTASLVARLATPRRVPLVFSIHNPMSEDAYTKNRLALPLEKLTYRKRHALISVSRSALDDFEQWVGVRGQSFVLPNFINDAYLEAARVRRTLGKPLRLIAVGMLKAQKNYFYLIEAFRRMRGAKVALDIYGDGPLRAELQRAIDAGSLPIRLLGKRPDVYNRLDDYDLYVMPSRYEGFGIAPVEAMAAGLPLLLSDLPVLREISYGNALFFDIADPEALPALLRTLGDREAELADLSERGIALAREHYRRDSYVEKLAAIYAQVAPGLAARKA
jgi:glycosyltransferase involved in cell wall biosynthesis